MPPEAVCIFNDFRRVEFDFSQKFNRRHDGMNSTIIAYLKGLQFGKFGFGKCFKAGFLHRSNFTIETVA